MSTAPRAVAPPLCRQIGCSLRVADGAGKVAYKLCCVDGCIFPLERLVLEGVEHAR